MTDHNAPILWWKSSHSANGNCVEIAHLDDAVAVRDSEHPDGPTLEFTAAAWRAFLVGVADGQFDRAEDTT